MSTEEQLAELHALLEKIAAKRLHQQDLIDELHEQIARFNEKYFAEKQPIPLGPEKPATGQTKSA